MKKIYFFIVLLFFSALVFSQESNSAASQISSEPAVQDNKKDDTGLSETGEKKADQNAENTNIQEASSKPAVNKEPPVRTEETRLLTAIEANPKSAELYNRLIRYYNNQGKHKERLKTALKAIQNIGRTVNWCLIVGDENKYLGDFQNALISYQFALMLLPSDPEIYNRIGLILLKLSNFNQAEAAFKAAIFFSSNEGPASKSIYYNNLGISYEGLHDIPTAYKYFQISVKYYPAFTTAQDNVKRVKELLLNAENKPN